jgi:archaellum biogenesis protein FlaJ (TadC family)
LRYFVVELSEIEVILLPPDMVECKQRITTMSTEAQVAMLMLRLLIDTPKELQKVLDYLQSELTLRKAILEVGNKKIATKEEIFSDFLERYGLTFEILDEETSPVSDAILPEDLSSRMRGLPSEAKYRVR